MGDVYLVGGLVVAGLVALVGAAWLRHRGRQAAHDAGRAEAEIEARTRGERAQEAEDVAVRAARARGVVPRSRELLDRLSERDSERRG